MSIFLGILVSITVFSLIILFHEYGHFKAARIFGVRVEEFGLGIPPRAKKLWKDKKGTLYTLNWLPLGGFVKLRGENQGVFLLYNKKGTLLTISEIETILKKDADIFDKNGDVLRHSEKLHLIEKIRESKEKDNLYNIPYYQQIIIVLAGVCMNFILAIIIFFILFLIGVKPLGINDRIPTQLDIKLIPTFEQALQEGILMEKPGLKMYPLEQSIAQKTGIQDGDIVYMVNGQKVSSGEDFIRYISNSAGKGVLLNGERNGTPLNLSITPNKEGKIGAYIGKNIEVNNDFVYKYGPVQSFQSAIQETWNQSLLTLKALSTLLTNIFFPIDIAQRKEAIDSLSGPIGVVNIMTQSVSSGISIIAILGAIISINLAVFNILPIPALDGGRCVFIILNWIKKVVFRKNSTNFFIENYIHALFLLLLIALSIFIGYNDIVKLMK